MKLPEGLKKTLKKISEGQTFLILAIVYFVGVGLTWILRRSTQLLTASGRRRSPETSWHLRDNFKPIDDIRIPF